MPQLNAYIDKSTMEKIKLAASNGHVSVSKWVRNKLAEALQDKWPSGYDNVLGALSDSELSRPSQPPFSNDSKRESL